MGGKLKLPAFAFQQLMHDVFVGPLKKSTRGWCCKRKKIKVKSATDEKRRPRRLFFFKMEREGLEDSRELQ